MASDNGALVCRSCVCVTCTFRTCKQHHLMMSNLWLRHENLLFQHVSLYTHYAKICVRCLMRVGRTICMCVCLYACICVYICICICINIYIYIYYVHTYVHLHNHTIYICTHVCLAYTCGHSCVGMHHSSCTLCHWFFHTDRHTHIPITHT